jgi:hypothetical protein
MRLIFFSGFENVSAEENEYQLFQQKPIQPLIQWPPYITFSGTDYSDALCGILVQLT